MNKYLITLSILSISACSVAKDRPELEYQFPICGISQLNGKAITKVCATRDYIEKKPKQKRDWLAFLAAEGNSSSEGHKSLDYQRISIDIRGVELDMQGHIWDFKNQERYGTSSQRQGSPSLILNSSQSIIKNGVILRPLDSNYGMGIGENNYIFKFYNKYINDDNLVSRYRDIANNVKIEKMKIQVISVYFPVKEGAINQSILNLKYNIKLEGSKKSLITKNTIISTGHTYLSRNESLNENNSSSLINNTIINLKSVDDSIPSLLFISYSPDTIVDGNTFMLTHKKDSAYAIVLDHSPRVRITNNTFNGFKVPILMDQWSSIIDDKGNVLNSNQFAGDVTMNRKGEIVKK